MSSSCRIWSLCWNLTDIPFAKKSRSLRQNSSQWADSPIRIHYRATIRPEAPKQPPPDYGKTTQFFRLQHERHLGWNRLRSRAVCWDPRAARDRAAHWPPPTCEGRRERVKGLGAIEGAIFGLLGLILAFSFSGALTRFDARRHLVIEEANDIGTAWLRISLLPADAQPSMRELFRRYLDSRIEVYKRVPDMPDMEAVRAALARSTNLQSEIWALAVSSSREAGTAQAPLLLLPALNTMFDIATTRTEATRLDPPMIIFALQGALTLACSLFAGYDMAIRRRLNVLYSVAFAVVLSVTAYVIIDLEYPRHGLIQVSDSDQVLIDLRRSMN